MAIYKRNPPLGALCGSTPGEGGSTVSDYWSSVTCELCIALKPMTAGRTSFKHSHRAEGGDLDDVLG